MQCVRTDIFNLALIEVYTPWSEQVTLYVMHTFKARRKPTNTLYLHKKPG